MRSESFPTHYHVGWVCCERVFWSPGQSVAVEKDHRYLIALRPEQLDEVEWLPLAQMKNLHAATVLAPGIIKAMPDQLLAAICEEVTQ